MKKQLRLSLTLLLLFLAYAAITHAQSACGGPPSDVPPAESCPEACIYCSFDGYMGTTAGYQGNGIPPGGFCSMIQNDQWLGFIAGASSATFTVIPTNCSGGNGVQVALYENCNTSPLACNGGCAGCGNQTTTIVATMVIGTNYFLLIDGFSGDECDLQISVSPPNAVKAPLVGPLSAMQGRDTVCPGSTVEYMIPSVTGAGAYTWSTTTPGVTFNGKFSPAILDAPEGQIVNVSFPDNLDGPVQLCVNANNSCNSGGSMCKTVQVTKPPVIVLPTVTIPTSQLPYALPWGEFANASGTYQITLTSSIGCDSTVQLQVVACQQITNLPAREFCADTCITVCGLSYCKTGTYSAQCSTSGTCDSIVNFTLTIVSPPKVLPGSRLALTCKDTALTLNATSGGGNMAWYNEKNQLLASTNFLKVTLPGIYTAKSLLSGGTECGSRAVQVKQNKQKPAITAKGGVLTPNMTTVTLMAKSTTSGVLYFWTGPAGFTSQQRNPIVSLAGFYTVTVIDPANGCSNNTTVEVTVG